jgi:membrane protein implicated in regulation of membrane protease activity
MSFMTLIFTGGHLLFVDMAQMDMGYKVIAFLVFAAISIGLTLYYTKWIKKKATSDEETSS